ncbi:uncharacterized protein LOC117647309 [Thrips palmi]|uniref:Uncharacterized protein LOC117647309 n=1 Tax=Thrips palmi TaxID=161013 RepID=A0A6P8ZBA7_THRPL|nr:uncharacterized protein LOC117647309 [Thrips palmi]
MDTLPPELVVCIFGKLRCPLTLLDVVPLVCKQWRNLSKDPLAWASAELAWDGTDPKARKASGLRFGSMRLADSSGDEDDDVSAAWEKLKEDSLRVSTADAARILLHAPALNCINFCADMPEKGMKRLVNALRRSRTVVTQYFTVHEMTSWHMTLRGRSALLDMMWRSRNHLVGATVQLSRQEDISDDVPASKRGPLRDSQGRTVLDVLAQMPTLECLSLDASWDYPYAGELRGKLPRLRKLFMNRGDGGICGERLVCDLIDGAAATLAGLDLNRDYGRPQDSILRHPRIPDYRAAVTPALMASVAGCKRLSFLEGPAALAPHLPSMPALAELVLHLYPERQRAEEAIKRVFDACERVAKLTFLELWVNRDNDEECFLVEARWHELKNEELRCKKLVKDFKTKRPTVELNFNFH